MSLLLALPQELRDRIWSLAIEEHVYLGHAWSSVGAFGVRDDEAVNRIRGRAPIRGSLLRTCRQVLREVTPLFYEKVCVTMSDVSQVCVPQCPME